MELLLRRSRTVIDRNVYWLSTQPDVVNWAKTLGQPQGVLFRYANLQALQRLPRSSISAVAVTTAQAGPDGADRATTVTITNTSPATVALLLRADVRRGTASGQELSGHNELPSSIWRSNDITLFPGESQTLTVTWNSADLRGATPVVSVSGWNVPKIDILASGWPAPSEPFLDIQWVVPDARPPPHPAAGPREAHLRSGLLHLATISRT